MNLQLPNVFKMLALLCSAKPIWMSSPWALPTKPVLWRRQKPLGFRAHSRWLFWWFCCCRCCRFSTYCNGHRYRWFYSPTGCLVWFNWFKTHLWSHIAFGMIAFASSFDQAGTLSQDVKDSALYLQVMAGFDKKDSTSSPKPVDDYLTVSIIRFRFKNRLAKRVFRKSRCKHSTKHKSGY